MARLTPQQRIPAIAAAGSFAVLVGYLVLVSSEGDFSSRVWYFVAHLVSVVATATYGAVGADPGKRALALSWADFSLMVLGVIALSSIGLPLLVFGLVLYPTAMRSRMEVPRRTAIAALLVSLGPLVVVALGLAFTE